MDGWNKEEISQLQLPDSNDTDPHLRLLLNGYGIHAGSCYTALMPDGGGMRLPLKSGGSRLAPPAGTYQHRGIGIFVRLAFL